MVVACAAARGLCGCAAAYTPLLCSRSLFRECLVRFGLPWSRWQRRGVSAAVLPHIPLAAALAPSFVNAWFVSVCPGRGSSGPGSLRQCCRIYPDPLPPFPRFEVCCCP